MATKKDSKKRRVLTKTAVVVGASIRDSGVLWCVRLKVPSLPFYLESAMSYTTQAEAEAEAEKWRKRTVTVSW